MVPSASTPDAHADPTWLVRIRTILRLNRGGVVVGLEGAHPACAGPLIEVLLEGGADVRVCFAAREVLEAPEDARVVLLNAARDAEFLNLARPVVADRRLRLLVWLRPGDRRVLGRKASDFLDWMQESVDIPEFVPGYAIQALHHAIDEREWAIWEGPPLRELVPNATVVTSAELDDEDMIAAMRRGPVVLHRPNGAAAIARVQALERVAGEAVVLIEEPEQWLSPKMTRIVAEPLDWEVASAWLEQAGVNRPRIEAARLQLDPLEVSRRAGRDPPPPLAWGDRSAAGVSPARPVTRVMGEASSPGEASRPLAPPAEPAPVWRDWWRRTFELCQLEGPPEDPALIVERPELSPGLGRIADSLLASTEPQVHLVTGAVGSGVSTELLVLGRRVHEQRCVVMFDVFDHFIRGVRDLSSFERLAPWTLIALLGLAAIRVGRDRWNVRWGKNPGILGMAMRSSTNPHVDVEQLVSALSGVGSPDGPLPSTGQWTLAMDVGHDASESWALDGVIEELARVHDPGLAMVTLKRAGFPPSMIPQFESPLAFWHRVVEAAANGAVVGGLHSIVDAAAEQYPHNEIFSRHHGGRSRRRSTREQLELARAVRLIVEELSASTGRGVTFILDGLGRLRSSALVDELLGALRRSELGADLVLRIPQESLARARSLEHVETVSHIDDLPVIDAHEPTKPGPGIAFLRELLERRFASNPHERPPIPDIVLDRLCWASGGRVRECLRLVCNLAVQAWTHPLDPVDDLTTKVILRHQVLLRDGVTREEHTVLESLLRELVEELPEDEAGRKLYDMSILRLYPTPEGGYRALPHPLLIDPPSVWLGEADRA